MTTKKKNAGGKVPGGGKPAKSARNGGPRQGSTGKTSRPPWLPPNLVHGKPQRPAHAKDPPVKGRERAESPGRMHGSVFDPHADREASRYEQPIASREAILSLLTNAEGPLTADRIADALGMNDERQREALDKRLAAMLRDGQVLKNRREGFGLAAKLDLIAGTVIGKADGYGFLRPDVGGDDLFLSPSEMRQVMHGDRVLVNRIGMDRRGRPEAAIAEVLERRVTRVVGRFEERAGLYLVVPDDRRLQQDVLIAPKATMSARNGQIVVVEIDEPPSRDRPPIGHVAAILGDRLEAGLIVDMAIESHGLPRAFPPAAIRESEQIAPTVPESAIGDRLDLRQMPLVTIDGEDARDFDDAVFCEPVRGGWRLVVAIADVAHYVRPGTALDTEAFDRATSVYFPGFVIPMLPEALSNGICSLNPAVDRLCLVCDMRITKTGEVTKSTFHRAVMRSHARLTYRQVHAAVTGDGEAQAAIGDLMGHIRNLHALYGAMAIARRQRGAIDFESPEIKFTLDAAGKVQSAKPEHRNDAHKLIEECMIAANVEAARFVERAKLPALYRVHAKPPEDKYAELASFLREFKISLPGYATITPLDFAALLERVRQRPEAPLLEQVVLRAQSLAVYAPECQGHFGLALDAYAHFTSPIRRYPDLLVHRAIHHVLLNGKPNAYPEDAESMARRGLQCSQRERRADEAEREVDERYQCAFMSEHVGSVFDGVISGVTSFGCFIALGETGVSGLIHVTQLPLDYYHFDAARRELKGERSQRRFRLGDTVKVQVLRASMEERKVDLKLAEAGPSRASQAESAVPAGQKPKAFGKGQKPGKMPHESGKGKRHKR